MVPLITSLFLLGHGFFEVRATHRLEPRTDSESHSTVPPQPSLSTRESTFSYPLELSLHPSHHHRLAIIIPLKRQNGILAPYCLSGTIPTRVLINDTNYRVSNTLPISTATKYTVALNVKPISQLQMNLSPEYS